MNPTTDLLVVPAGPRASRGTLRFGGNSYPCVLGRGGVVVDKREGDGATPLGRFPLRRVLYRADRGGAPTTSLPVSAIAADDGWCDAPSDPAYNRPVKLPYPASAEALYRQDRLYDLLVVLGHNDAPVRPGAGSAIFLHVAPEDGGPTAGCIALAPEHLRAILRTATPASAVVVADIG
jgi:L,D-peptidoglycan transpeptidase YkuD (ErfK/YbiS/YcfS/YnhG family)